MSYWVVAHSILIIVSVVKIMSLTRMFYEFAFLNRLIKQVMIDIIPFFTYYLAWLVILTLLFIVSGVRPYSNSDNHNNGFNSFAASALQVFLDSIDFVIVPDNSFWQTKNNDHPIMIYWSKFLFFFVEFFLYVTMLNFLVAKMMDSY